jgi:hypothetical protein
MGKQSRRYHSRKTPLHLETFERRNLLSGMNHLLSPWLSSPPSTLFMGPTNQGTPFTNQTPAIGPTLEALVQLGASGKGGAVQDSTLDNLFVSLKHLDKTSIGSDTAPAPTPPIQQAADNVDTSSQVLASDGTSSSDNLIPATDSQSDSTPVVPSASDDAHVDASQAIDVSSIHVTASSKPFSAKVATGVTAVNLKDSHDNQSASTSAQIDVNPEAPRTPIDAYISDASAAGQQDSGKSNSSADPSAGSAVTGDPSTAQDSSSAGSSSQQNAMGTSGANSTSTASRGQAIVSSPASPASNNIHASFNLPTAGVGETRTTESPASLDHANALNNRPDYAATASVGFDSKTAAMLFSRQAAPAEFQNDPIAQGREQIGLQMVRSNGAGKTPAQGADLFLQTDDGDESSVSGSARGAGLLGSPVPFDLDSLTREAQQFLEQVDQLGQDLASLLTQMNVSPWAVAAAVAATAIAVSRRRSRRTQRALSLDGAAFGCSAGLGAALDVSAVLADDA